MNNIEEFNTIVNTKNMKWYVLSGLTLLMLLVLYAFTFKKVKPANQKNKNEEQVEKLLSTMTLEEKVGQMTQITLDVISKRDGKGNVIDPHQLDYGKLDTAISQFHVGSILNVGYHTFDKKHWRKIIPEIQNYSIKNGKSGIPILYGIDAIHGATYTVDATLFPQEIGLAATWNPSLVEKAAGITAYEVRASCIPWNFSPVLDIGRQPLWSRFFETFGEDVYLTKIMGASMVKGYQGDDFSSPYKVASCLKHYVGYSLPVSGKDRSPAWIPERYLKEYFLPSFEKSIQEGAMTVMVNSSEINGVPGHANYHLLTEVLKGELNFKGFAVSDWEDIIMLHTVHHIASSEKEAVKIAIMAGIDMSMVPYSYKFSKCLIELVKEGQVPMSRIDDAVRRILRVKFQLNLFNKTYYDESLYTKFGSKEFSDVSYQAALESITLLKNKNNILPLSKTAKVLITGVASNLLNPLNGAWTHTWQGLDTSYNTKNKKTILQAIKDKVGAEKVIYVEGTSYDKDINTEKVILAAKAVDYVIVCVGELPATEKPGDIDDLSMALVQLELIEKITKTGTPVVLVMAQGRPRIISTVENQLSGIVLAYLPGNEGGRAIADVLFGDYNPNGKLPYTYPRYTGTLVPYDHKYSERRSKTDTYDAYAPQYEFGFGLSYTSFKYSSLSLAKDTLNSNDSISVFITVKNIGKISGQEVVQLYIRDEFSSITPPIKRLRAFRKITLQAGESKVVNFKLHPTELSFVDLTNSWKLEAGSFEAEIGGLKKIFYINEIKAF